MELELPDGCIERRVRAPSFATGGMGRMIDRDQFITNYVAAFMAGIAADRYHTNSVILVTEPGPKRDRELEHMNPSGRDAYYCARIAWVELLRYGVPTR
jgi:hypothetical protein